MKPINIKSGKVCAFCRYWYDPTNECINPRNPSGNLWEYDQYTKRKCLKKGIEMPASALCGFYQCKVLVNKKTVEK